ncbi:MAG: alpha-L-glutamate ligase-like protein, partial [Parcubacteria group bacterium]|nr:alpha-L-glutamate ligase-like protein [Parcubacteria group bacterium]
MAQNDILGMNERNLHYIRPYNKKKATRLADSKLDSKELLIKTGIPTPKLYGVLKNIKDFEDFDW